MSLSTLGSTSHRRASPSDRAEAHEAAPRHAEVTPADRTRAFVQVTLRIEQWMIDAADAYAVALAEQSPIRAKRTDALRAFLRFGIERLEAEAPLALKKDGGKMKKKRK